MKFARVRRSPVLRHPVPILALWAVRGLGALVVAAPVAAALSAGLEHQPRADTVLFAPGGAYLLEAIRLNQRALAVAVPHAVWASLVVGGLCLVPLAALLIALAPRGRGSEEAWLEHTAHHVPGLALLAGLTVLVQATVGTLTAIIALGARPSLARQLGQRGGDSSLIVLVGVALVLIVGIGVVQDLARAAAVRHDCTVVDCIRTATAVALANPGRVTIAWLTPAVWSMALALAAVMVTRAVRLEAATDWQWGVLVATHQLAALGIVALRATWLARAVTLVESPSRP